jgi:hypothetical protein
MREPTWKPIPILGGSKVALSTADRISISSNSSDSCVQRLGLQFSKTLHGTRS